MTERIEKVINIFLDAINEGTLAKGTCVACAVGNLVAHGMNLNIKDLDWCTFTPNTEWRKLFCEGVIRINAQAYIQDAAFIQNIQATDFTWRELAEIEKVFESNTKIMHCEYEIFSEEDVRLDQINGLKAVIEVMMTFDKVKDDVDEVFTKRALELC